MALPPTIYDIAKRAGVGIATVSRVLNGSERVADATRQAVQKAMHDLDFRPNRAARRLAVGGLNRSRVAALMPFFSASFYYAVSAPLSAGLLAADMDLVLYNIQDRDHKNRVLDRIVAERACEGLVLVSMGVREARVAELARVGIPLVCVDYPQVGAPALTVDNVEAGRIATRHLLDGGAIQPALITGPSAALAFRQREEGFTATAGTDAPQVRAEAVTIEAGRAAAARLLDSHPQADGLVCVNDMLAVGALQEVRARGRTVPEQVQLIGFDDQPLMDVIGLSTIRQPMAEFGAWAARTIARLLDRTGERDGRQMQVEALQLPIELVVRATSRAAGAAGTTPRRRR
jgi:DNA-binding LacI/PurR family transcriptional regulator